MWMMPLRLQVNQISNDDDDDDDDDDDLGWVDMNLLNMLLAFQSSIANILYYKYRQN